MKGARPGFQGAIQRLVARAIARELTAFVVPERAVALAAGLDLAAAGLNVAPTPRHASLLLVIGDLPEGLAEAAATVLAQMPRPRLVLAVGGSATQALPADITVPLGQPGLEDGVRQARALLEQSSWSPDADIAPPSAEEEHQSGHDHAAMGHDHGDGGHEGHDDASHESHDHHATGDSGMDHGEMDHGGLQEEPSHDHAAMGHDAERDSEESHDHREMHHGMDHSDMDHGGGGFMSMVMMTQDLPRSRDGLPMEWVPTPFGPLFPGLPAGLTPTLTLDGDVVAEVSLGEMATCRDIPDTLPGPAASLPDRLAALDPFSPVSYRLLAQRALEAASGHQPDDATSRARVGALEWERIASHLGWLASFGELLGLGDMANRAAALRLAMARLPVDADATPLRDDIASFIGRVERIPLLLPRLQGIGVIAADTGAPMHGPVARASGIATDARIGDPAYRSPYLTPIIRQGGDAWARLQVRLGEIARSLDLVSAAGTRALPEVPIAPDVSGLGAATVETPRGAATLTLQLHNGQVHHAELHTPSMDHVALVEHVATGSELADALVGIASLDLSPWEVER